jgi:hypothetical protein
VAEFAFDAVNGSFEAMNVIRDAFNRLGHFGEAVVEIEFFRVCFGIAEPFGILIEALDCGLNAHSRDSITERLAT